MFLTKRGVFACLSLFVYLTWGVLKKNGEAEATIDGRTKLLEALVKRGANLYDPETIKDVIAKQTWGNGRKNNPVDAHCFVLSFKGCLLSLSDI